MNASRTKRLPDAIEGKSVRLVQYLPEHVPKYHSWMKQEDLLELTASEPLTLEEEYKMQESWSKDPDKLTFILLDKSLPDTPGVSTTGGAMAGDVNVFFRDDIDGAEIEVMVAEPASRRKGIAQEALELMMRFAAEEYGVGRFVAKIIKQNESSLRLFREKLGFTDVEYISVFETYVLEKRMPGREGGRSEPSAGLGPGLGLGLGDATPEQGAEDKPAGSTSAETRRKKLEGRLRHWNAVIARERDPASAAACKARKMAASARAQLEELSAGLSSTGLEGITSIP